MALNTSYTTVINDGSSGLGGNLGINITDLVNLKKNVNQEFIDISNGFKTMSGVVDDISGIFTGYDNGLASAWSTISSAIDSFLMAVDSCVTNLDTSVNEYVNSTTTNAQSFKKNVDDISTTITDIITKFNGIGK